jgi:hypothetical protein
MVQLRYVVIERSAFRLRNGGLHSIQSSTYLIKQARPQKAEEPHTAEDASMREYENDQTQYFDHFDPSTGEAAPI